MSEDRQAWEAWLARLGPAAFLYARQLTGSAADAEDAVQDGFIRFWRSRGKARDRVAFFYACVKSAILDQRRGEQRRKRRERVRAQEHGLGEPMFMCSSPEDLERREIVERALVDLPEEQREAVVLRLWGGLTFAEIGQAVGAPLHTVAARYRYALEKIGGSLTPEESHG